MARTPESELKETAKKLRRHILEAITKAGSGHPGTAMASARPPMCRGPGSCGSVPVDPEWFDRDWFVLSAGHAWCCSLR